MITNPAGHIAMKWVIQGRNPPPVKIDGTDRIYIFTPQCHVFLAWVYPEDVDRMLTTKSKVCNCNNGTYKLAFEKASRLDVALWSSGDRHWWNEEYKEIE